MTEDPVVTKGRVLIIAGSDSGGGAGIQADIKTVSALGGYAMTAITALTAQNTQGVFGIHGVPVEFVRSQIQVVMDDLGADCIKIGMLGTVGVIETVADALDRYARDVPVVLDPVMVAKGGHPLLEADAADALRSLLVPRASLLTPNLPEAAVLLGRPMHSVADMERAVDAARALKAEAVLLKGGHLEGEKMVDFLIERETVERFEGIRIVTANTHGTGCTTASAVATGIAQGMSLRESVRRARDFVRRAIVTAPGYGRGHGPLNHAHTLSSERIR